MFIPKKNRKNTDTKFVGINLPADLNEQIRILARNYGISKQELLLQMVTHCAGEAPMIAEQDKTTRREATYL